MTCEREVKKYLYKRCKEHGFDIRKVVWENRCHAPDTRILGFLWVELKRPSKTWRAAQRKEAEDMIAQGEAVIMVNTFEAVDDLMRTLVAWRSFSSLENISKKSSTIRKSASAVEYGALWEEVKQSPR